MTPFRLYQSPLHEELLVKIKENIQILPLIYLVLFFATFFSNFYLSFYQVYDIKILSQI